MMVPSRYRLATFLRSSSFLYALTCGRAIHHLFETLGAEQRLPVNGIIHTPYQCAFAIRALGAVVYKAMFNIPGMLRDIFVNVLNKDVACLVLWYV